MPRDPLDLAIRSHLPMTAFLSFPAMIAAVRLPAYREAAYQAQVDNEKTTVTWFKTYMYIRCD